MKNDYDKVVIYSFSDVHLSKHNSSKEHNKIISEEIKKYISEECKKNKENIRNYVVIPGDVMDDNKDDDDKAYLSIWQNNDSNNYLVCEGFGNHDVVTHWDFSHARYLGRYEFISNVQAPFRGEALKNDNYVSLSIKQNVSGIDPQYKDAYYRWSNIVNGVRIHFIMLNLAMGDDDSDKKGSDKYFFYKSKQFLQESLKSIGKDDPIIIFQHYGIGDNGGTYDWWPEADQNSFIKIINGYNISAIIHGHTHNFKYMEVSTKIIDGKEYNIPQRFRVGNTNSNTKDWSILKIVISKSDDFSKGDVIIQYEEINKNGTSTLKSESYLS